MTKDDWIKIGAIPAITIFLVAMQAYGDNRWITISSTLEAKLFEYQENIWLLERQDVLTEDDKDKLEFYKLKVLELEQKLD
jgi:hypothetical protein